jgi:hypothetical protein
MLPGADAARPAPPSPRWLWPAVALLLALYAVMAFSASMQKGVSFDETEQLGVGYNIWLNHDFRMEGANGDFVKRWATLPFLFTQPAFPATSVPNWLRAQPYGLGYQFLFESGNQAGTLLLESRLMILLLGLATGLLVFICSREIFGPVGGLFSLALFAFCPHMLAYSGIVSTEMSLCLGLLGATWSLWRLLHRVTWGRLLLSLLFFSLLFLSKTSALVIFPIAAVLVTARLLSRRPLEWRLGRPRLIQSRATQATLFFTLFLVHGFVCWVVLWAHYDFRYDSSPNPADPRVLAWLPADKNPLDPVAQSILTWTRATHLLPAGYLDGVEMLLAERQTHLAFIDGQWRLGGSRTFFPYAIWAKTSPFLFLLLILGFATWWYTRHPRKAAPQLETQNSKLETPSFYAALPYVTLFTVFLAVAIIQSLNIGHRHILPIYPALYILVGGALGLVWLSHRRLMKGLLALLLCGYLAESLTLYPNYLAYFSPAVGGPASGYKLLVDSSLDWGQDLPDLKHWLDQNNPGHHLPVYLAYFGTDNPDYYGIQANRLPSYPQWHDQSVKSLDAGIYAISATLFQSIYTSTEGPWNRTFESDYQNCLKNLRTYNDTLHDPARHAALLQQYPYPLWVQSSNDFTALRFGRLCAWLRHNREPTDNIDHSILIWKLTRHDIDEALGGPPAELAANPVTAHTPFPRFKSARS